MPFLYNLYTTRTIRMIIHYSILCRICISQCAIGRVGGCRIQSYSWGIIFTGTCPYNSRKLLLIITCIASLIGSTIRTMRTNLKPCCTGERETIESMEVRNV